MEMSDSRKNIIVASIGVLLVALTLVSCEKRDDYYGSGNNSYSETIGFRVIDPMTQTRNYRGLAKVDNDAIDYKTVLRSDNSSDSLHLTTYVGDMNSQQYLMTRASAFTTDNLANFVVYGYNSTAQTFDYSDNFIFADIAKKQTDGTWRFDTDVVWPSGKSDFFAIANTDNNTGVAVSAGDNETPSLTYIVPTEVTDHKDVVVARSGVQEANTSLVPLNFQHVFTAVQFKFGEIKKAGQIHSISIEGIHLNGSLDLAYESASGFMAMNAWSYNDDGTATFSLPLDNNTISSSNNNNASIGTLDNGFALMMIPQTLVGAKLKIVYTPEGGSKITMEANLIGTWAAGKVVTYTISIAEILDLWFNNTTEICLDAHYVMDNKLSVHIGEDVTKNRGTWTLTSSEDWLTIKTDRTGLQEEGYWIIEDKGSMSLATQSTKGDLNIWLFATENNSTENRTAMLTLSNSKNNDKRTFKITQMCPQWIELEGKTIGAERIEELPPTVSWGPYWTSTSGGSLKVTYKLKNIFLSEEKIYYIFSISWAGADKSEISHNGYDILGYPVGASEFTFDYSKSQNEIVSGTSSGDDGLSNTKTGFSKKVATLTTFEDMFKNNSNAEVKSTTIEEHSFTESALLSVIKKNAFNKKEEDGVEVADIDPAKIVWYLPAINEAVSGVYQENTEAHACETSFLNNGVGKVYWTSTSVDAGSAYTYKYGDMTTTTSSAKDVTYHVRAIRQK